MALKINIKIIFLAILFMGISLFLVMATVESAAQSDVAPTSIVMQVSPVMQEGPKFFIDFVERHSGGRIVFESFTTETLGSDEDVGEMLYYGEIDIMTGHGPGTFVPSVLALSHPFLWGIEEFLSSTSVDTPIFKKFQEIVREESNNNLHVLSCEYASSRNVYTIPGPIRVPNDLVTHNIRIRVPEDPLHMGMWSAFGATPVGVPGEQRFEAMQTGMVNAAEGGLSSAIAYGLVELTNYTTLTDHVITPVFIIVNAEWYDSLSEDLKDIVNTGARLASAIQNEYVTYVDGKAVGVMEEDFGIEIVELTPDERALWRDIASEVAIEIMEKENVNPEFLQLILDTAAGR